MSSSRDRRTVPTLRTGPLALLLIAATMTVSRASVAAPKVAIVETRNTSIVIGAKEAAADHTRARRQIEATVATAAAHAGAELVQSSQLAAAGLADCSAADCFKRIGSATGASYVLVVDAMFDQDAFKIHLDMWSAVTGEHLDGDGRDCDGCSVNELMNALQDRTTLLCERVFRAQASAPPIRNPGDLVLPPSAPAPVLVTPPSNQPPEKTGPSLRWLGWTLIGAGVAAGAASAVFFAINHNQGGCPATPIAGDPDACALERKTITPAIVSAAVAAGALVGGGIILLRTKKNDSGLALSLQPLGLTLGGRL
jgi:hypothetical protein